MRTTRNQRARNRRAHAPDAGSTWCSSVDAGSVASTDTVRTLADRGILQQAGLDQCEQALQTAVTYFTAMGLHTL